MVPRVNGEIYMGANDESQRDAASVTWRLSGELVSMYKNLRSG